MDHWDSVDSSNENSMSWRRLAPRKMPKRLRDLSRTSVASAISRIADGNNNRKDLHDVCSFLKVNLPLELRSSVMKEIASYQKVNNPQRALTLLLMHLLTDVQHVAIASETSKNQWLRLQEDDCQELLTTVRGLSNLSLESLSVQGISLERGILPEILRRSRRLRNLHLSGDTASEALLHLNECRERLQTLILDNCTVNDEDLVQALTGCSDALHVLGTRIFEGEELSGEYMANMNSLKKLSVHSPLLTICGAMVLLHSLRQLHYMQYTSWSTSVSDTLLFLQEITPNAAPFSLSSLATWRPSTNAISNISNMCPRLQHLMIECNDPEVTDLSPLGSLVELKALTLRLVSEDFINSVIKVVGNNLQELEIEFEDYSYHPLAWDTLCQINSRCPYLRKLILMQVNLTSTPRAHPVDDRSMFTELVHLELKSSLAEAPLLRRMLKGNTTLENLVIDVSQDSLTDEVLAAWQGQNDLKALKEVHLGAGSLSPVAITSLLSLPALSKLSIDLKRFPYISVSTFTMLESNLTKGNYQCVLENVVNEE